MYRLQVDQKFSLLADSVRKSVSQAINCLSTDVCPFCGKLIKNSLYHTNEHSIDNISYKVYTCEEDHCLRHHSTSDLEASYSFLEVKDGEDFILLRHYLINKAYI